MKLLTRRTPAAGCCLLLSAFVPGARTAAAPAAAGAAAATRPASTQWRSLPEGAAGTLQLTSATVAALRARLDDAALADGRIGVSVRLVGLADSAAAWGLRAMAPAGGAPLFVCDAEKRFLPASNMKLFTAALALKTLGAGARFSTTVVAAQPPRDGVVAGELVVRGGGDPSLDIADLQNLAERVHGLGIREVHGVRVDGSAFGGGNINDRYPEGWTLDDGLWDYGAEVSAFALHRNAVELVVLGGPHEGAAARTNITPNLPGFMMGRELRSSIGTGGAGLAALSEDDLVHVDRALASSLDRAVRLSGAVAPGQVVRESLAVPGHEQWAAQIFAAQLEKAGVRVMTPASAPRASHGEPVAEPTKLLVHRSAPLADLMKTFLKTSDNLYGEMLLRDAACGVYGAGQGTAAHGHDLLRRYLTARGIGCEALRFSDGSGLSRYNLLTPDAVSRLLAALADESEGAALWNALPIAGIDGTLRRRMVGTAAQGNVRAKTGTFSIVSCLSGYVTTRDGCRLAVSVLTNNVRRGDDARKLQNDIFELLAGAELTVAAPI